MGENQREYPGVGDRRCWGNPLPKDKPAPLTSEGASNNHLEYPGCIGGEAFFVPLHPESAIREINRQDEIQGREREIRIKQQKNLVKKDCSSTAGGRGFVVVWADSRQKQGFSASAPWGRRKYSEAAFNPAGKTRESFKRTDLGRVDGRPRRKSVRRGTKHRKQQRSTAERTVKKKNACSTIEEGGGGRTVKGARGP